MTHKTFGQKIIDHRSQNHTADDHVIEYRRAMEKEIIDNINTAINRALADEQTYGNKNFYMVIKERIEPVSKMPQFRYFTRLSCPTPECSQSAWKYWYKDQRLEYLWTIPAPKLYFSLCKKAQKGTVAPDETLLAQFCLLMANGSLLQWVKKENGEKKDAIIYNNPDLAREVFDARK